MDARPFQDYKVGLQQGHPRNLAFESEVSELLVVLKQDLPLRTRHMLGTGCHPTS
jgi:hypothetical protein